MEKTKGCRQVNIPTVDNTELPCDPYISEECVIISEAIPEIGSLDNESLGSVLIKMAKVIKKQSILISQLKKKIN
ncbi:MAG: hypothetical protein KC414_09240 [Romboutsia sp.]|nr:hypothetical protein [Romboutsia sp.]